MENEEHLRDDENREPWRAGVPLFNPSLVSLSSGDFLAIMRMSNGPGCPQVAARLVFKEYEARAASAPIIDPGIMRGFLNSMQNVSTFCRWAVMAERSSAGPLDSGQRWPMRRRHRALPEQVRTSPFSSTKSRRFYNDLVLAVLDGDTLEAPDAAESSSVEKD